MNFCRWLEEKVEQEQVEALREEARRKALVKTRERERKELARYPLHSTRQRKAKSLEKLHKVFRLVKKKRKKSFKKNSVLSRRMEDAQRLYNTAQKSLHTFLER